MWIKMVQYERKTQEPWMHNFYIHFQEDYIALRGYLLFQYCPLVSHQVGSLAGGQSLFQLSSSPLQNPLVKLQVLVYSSVSS